MTMLTRHELVPRFLIDIPSDVNEESITGWLYACKCRAGGKLKQHGLINQCLHWHIHADVYTLVCGQEKTHRYL
jgi:hypothetical protein